MESWAGCKSDLTDRRCRLDRFADFRDIEPLEPVGRENPEGFSDIGVVLFRKERGDARARFGNVERTRLQNRRRVLGKERGDHALVFFGGERTSGIHETSARTEGGEARLEELRLEGGLFPDVAFGPKPERPFVFGADAAFGGTRHVEKYRIETVTGEAFEIQQGIGL